MGWAYNLLSYKLSPILFNRIRKTMTSIKYDSFYRYDDLTELLHDFATEYPNLITLESIGKSYQGRDIWVATLTNADTGKADEKPAVWVDGNIHSVEVTASHSCLHFIQTLVNGYENDERITHALNTRAFYICPRINPDGAEAALSDNPKRVRSSMRPYPHDDEPISGLEQDDIDGDGRVLYMRIKDPSGPWKPHPDAPALLVPRAPDDYKGTFYHLYKEGQSFETDNAMLKSGRPKEGLDLNRNFPANFEPEGAQMGAGPAPFSEPETRAVGDFFLTHKNIFIAIAGHTFSGVLLRPGSSVPDEDLPVQDLQAYKAMGKRGQELSGYPAISVYRDFRYHPKEDIRGSFNWVYDHLGIFTWVIEYWAPHRAAGLNVENYSEWFFEHSQDDALKLYEYFEKELPGKGYVDWYEFDHPKLGKVELGGWDIGNTIHNPPFHLLEKELAPFPEWFIYLALISPKLELHKAEIEALGGDSYLLTMIIENAGYLPTCGSPIARDHKITRDIVVEIDLPDGAKLIQGLPWEEKGHLEGRVGMMPSPIFVGTGFDPRDGAVSRIKCQWIVQAAKGTTVTLSAHQERSGRVEASLACE